MTDLMLILWGVSSLVAMCTMFYMFIQRDSDFSLKDLWENKEDIVVLGVATVFPALLFLALLGAFLWFTYQQWANRRVRRILAEWRDTCMFYHHGVRLRLTQRDNTGEYELDYNTISTALRESANSLSDRDLKFLLGLHQDVVKIDQVIMDVLADEHIHRSLMDE